MGFRWQIAQAAEKRWWKKYLSGKTKEDYLQWKRDYWNNFLFDAKISKNGNFNVMDAGSGPAGIFMVLEGKNIFAVDPLIDLYSEMPHFDVDDYNNVHFVNSKLEDYVKEEFFDEIFCLNVINHVDNIEKSIKSLSKSIKVGGKLYLSIDAHNYYFLKKAFQLFPGDILHPQQYSIEDYCQFLTDNNFSVNEVKTIKKAFIFDYILIVAEKKCQ